MSVTKPRAFAPDDPRVTINTLPEPVTLADDGAVPVIVPPPPQRRRYGALFLGAISGLAFLALGISVERFIVDLFGREPALGWIALGLAILAAIGALGFMGREIGALWRLDSLAKLKARACDVLETDDGGEARRVRDDLVALYAKRPDMARGRRAVESTRGAVIDGRDLLTIVERDLMNSLDAEARLLVVQAAKRVSVVTAVSPRALIDVAFVIGQSLQLIRRVAELYGAGLGIVGFWRVARAVIAHLAVTGGIAIGDTLVQQMVGQGLAAKLSARLGEGVINGLMTARVGLAAIEVCRPLPFAALPPPNLSDLAGNLFKSAPPKEAES
jgi:putative membrane protein